MSASICTFTSHARLSAAAPFGRQPSGFRPRTSVAPRAAASGDLNTDALQRALATQLQQSSERAAPAPTADHAADNSAEEELAARQQEARRWISPWLDQAAKRQSFEIQRRLQQDAAAGLSSDYEAAALRRLVNRGSLDAADNVLDGLDGPDSSDSAGGATPPGGDGASVLVKPKRPAGAEGKNGNAAAGGKKDRLAPEALYEDGSLLFSSEALMAVDYEEVLAA